VPFCVSVDIIWSRGKKKREKGGGGGIESLPCHILYKKKRGERDTKKEIKKKKKGKGSFLLPQLPHLREKERPEGKKEEKKGDRISSCHAVSYNAKKGKHKEGGGREETK